MIGKLSCRSSVVPWFSCCRPPWEVYPNQRIFSKNRCEYLTLLCLLVIFRNTDTVIPWPAETGQGTVPAGAILRGPDTSPVHHMSVQSHPVHGEFLLAWSLSRKGTHALGNFLPHPPDCRRAASDPIFALLSVGPISSALPLPFTTILDPVWSIPPA